MASLDWVKTGYDVLKKANQLEIAEKLMGLREELLGIRENNMNLRTENEELKKQIEFKGKIIFEEGICWINNDEMSTSELPTPICPQCHQTNNIVNRLPLIDRGSNNSSIYCQKCESSFYLAN